MRLLQTRRSKAAEHCRTPKPGGNIALISRLAFWSATVPRRFSIEQATFYFNESAGTILILSTFIRFSGRSLGPVLVVAIFSKTSSPLISFPKVVY